MTPRLAILDIGATLVTGPPKGPAARIARRLGLDDEDKAALRQVLMSTPFTAPEEVSAHLGGGDQAIAEIWAAQEAEAHPIAGAADALERLRATGTRIALISNIWRPYLTSVRTHFGDFFDEHIPPELQLFSYREGHAKPAPEMFQRVCRAAGVQPQECVMVGDSYAEDIEPAAMLGMQTTWVLHRPDREAAHLARVRNHEAPQPSRVISAIGAL
jgi:HAD superfamily hydrolase (TIGR01509 family)